MLLSSMVDGLNNKTEIYYSSLALQDNYDTVLTLDFPLSRVNGSMYVVDTVKQYNLEGYIFYDPATYTKPAYFYRGGIMHRQGLGFLGFQEREVHAEQAHTLYSYELDATKTSMRLKKQTTQRNKGTFMSPVLLPLSETEYDNGTLVLDVDNGSQGLLPIVEKTVMRDSIYDTETVALNTFYNDGNLKSSTTFYGSEQTPIKTENKEYWYRVLYGVDHPNVIDSLVTTRTHADDNTNTYTRSIDYRYGNNVASSGIGKDRGATTLDIFHDPHLIATVSDPGTIYEVRDSLVYDHYGNVLKNIVTAPQDASIGAITTIYEYGAQYNGRYMTATIRPDTVRTEYVYDADMDVMVQQTVYGSTDTLVYDDWRRLVSTKSHDGVVTNEELSWALPNTDAFRSLIAQTHSSNNDYTVTSYRDVWGHTIRTKALLLHNKVSLRDAVVDKFGQVERTSRPYAPGATPRWTHYQYDEYNRPTVTTFKPDTNDSAKDLISSVAYDSLTTT